MIAFLLACTCARSDLEPESRPDSATDTQDTEDTEDTAPQERTTWQGPRAGEGFGAALASAGEGLPWVGAPWGDAGRVYQLEDDGVALTREEVSFGALGLALAEGPEGLAAGAPLRDGGAGGLSMPDGTDVAGGPGDLLGAVVAHHGGLLVTSTVSGVRVGDALVATPGRPTAVAQLDEQLVVGMAEGAVALRLGAQDLDRGTPGDLAGAALCVADLDEDGALDLAVGAPGAARVLVLRDAASATSLEDARVVQGPGGRFGHALACGPGELVVSAPLAGQSLGGAVWRLDADALSADALPVPVMVGEDDEQLGASLLLQGEWLYAGAPGYDGGRGRVRRLR